MTRREKMALEEVLTENKDDTIRRKLIQKYNKYYRHWQDLNLLVALFAMIGLALAISQWETTFMERGPDGKAYADIGFDSRLVICIVSVMGIIAIIFKFYFESVWQNYKNPVAFYKIIV